MLVAEDVMRDAFVRGEGADYMVETMTLAPASPAPASSPAPARSGAQRFTPGSCTLKPRDLPDRRGRQHRRLPVGLEPGAGEFVHHRACFGIAQYLGRRHQA